MKEVKLSIKINKPAAEVFAFCVNPENTPKWIDAILAEETNEWPPKLGTIYRNIGPEDVWRVYEMTAFEQDKMFVLSKKDGYSVKYTFTPINANTTQLEYYEWDDNGELDEVFTIDILEKLKTIIES